MVLDNEAVSGMERGDDPLTVFDVLGLSELVGESGAIVNKNVRKGGTTKRVVSREQTHWAQSNVSFVWIMVVSW